MFNKISKNKIIECVVILIFFILSAIMIVFKGLGDLDELWQYAFAKNIIEGLVPYNDFNIIVTPFYSVVGAIFLKCINNQLIVMRIYNTLLFWSILIFTYNIFKILKVNQVKSFIYTLIIYLMFINILTVEYNYMVLLIVLISLYIELKHLINNKSFDYKTNVFLGMLMGLTILTKQTIGILLLIMFIFYKIIFVKNKDEFKEFIKIASYRILGIIVPMLIFIMYLVINQALKEFISYTILGISEFDNKISYFTLLKNDNILIVIFALLLPILLTSIITLIKCRKDKRYSIILTLIIYSVVMFFGMFPGANDGHFAIYGFVGIITILYLINLLSDIKTLNSKGKIVIMFLNYFFECLIVLISIVCVGERIYNLVGTYEDNQYNTSNLNHYEYILIDSNFDKKIEYIGSYIKEKEKEGKKVLILDSSAVLYKIPINIYNKDYDMFNKGNFGKNGESRIIKEISESKDVIYLMLNDKYSKNWQTPLDIINYVKENKTKIGEIEEFDIYE